MKKILLLSSLFLLSGFSFSYATDSGCCSYHGGINFCGVDGYYVCNDYTESPSCKCPNPVALEVCRGYYNNLLNSFNDQKEEYEDSYKELHDKASDIWDKIFDIDDEIEERENYYEEMYPNASKSTIISLVHDETEKLEDKRFDLVLEANKYNSQISILQNNWKSRLSQLTPAIDNLYRICHLYANTTAINNSSNTSNSSTTNTTTKSSSTTTEQVERAKNYLGDKATLIESLSKSKKLQDNVLKQKFITVFSGYKTNSNLYYRAFGIYFTNLLENN